MFKLHATLLWNISDFLGLGSLSGWNTYTKLPYPSCNFDFIPLRLPISYKYCFVVFNVIMIENTHLDWTRFALIVSKICVVLQEDCPVLKFLSKLKILKSHLVKKKGNSPTKKEYVLNNVHRRKYHFTVGIVVLLFVIQLCKPDFCYIYHCVSVIP